MDKLETDQNTNRNTDTDKQINSNLFIKVTTFYVKRKKLKALPKQILCI